MKKIGKYEILKSETIIDDTDLDITMKLATAKASPWLVSIVSHSVPDDMINSIFASVHRKCYEDSNEDIVFLGTGSIIECHQTTATATDADEYVSTVITAATLFVRTNGLLPSQIKVDVYLFGAEILEGQVLACDFHYNLAAVRIHSPSPLPTATLRPLNDVFPIHPQSSFHLPPHSSLFKVSPGTNILALSRSFKPTDYDILHVYSGVFRSSLLDTDMDCNELYWVDTNTRLVKNSSGEPVINYSGELIGIAFNCSPFLPINIVSRWWKQFKSSRKYRRPWLGVEVANLYSSCIEFLEEFMIKFSNISTGVVVTKVADGSPAYLSGIRPKDVMIECNGKLVCSKLEFFDIIWDMVGECIEVNVLRASDGKEHKLRLTVEETTPDNYYKWPLTTCKIDR